jgi:hypothetical protein
MDGSIEDRLAVVEVCTRMAWHADQREWDALAAIFADKVRLDYTSLNGGEPADLTPEQIVDAWKQAFAPLESTQHLVTNHLVDIDGDEAVCTAAFQATHRANAAHGGALWTLGGTYRFDLIRVGSGWRISGVRMTAAWGDGNRDVMNPRGEGAR